MKYFDELKRTMEWVALQPRTIFLGQAVGVPGTFMFNTLKDTASEKRIELPVCESFQMQITLGMALSGYLPISVFPRQNFMMLGMGDLANMIDKMPDIAPDAVHQKVIIRTSVGPDAPVHPGHQHVGDFTDAFKLIFKNIDVVRLDEPQDIFPAYQRALDPNFKKSSLLIEVGNYYATK
jgi:pyruvate/2-oxoglutarate/acetoin dehydrogenase E1 component